MSKLANAAQTSNGGKVWYYEYCSKLEFFVDTSFMQAASGTIIRFDIPEKQLRETLKRIDAERKRRKK